VLLDVRRHDYYTTFKFTRSILPLKAAIVPLIRFPGNINTTMTPNLRWANGFPHDAANPRLTLLQHNPIYSYWQTLNRISSSGLLNETYMVANITLRKTGPTLRAEPSLYIILAVQPILILIVFFGPFVLFYTYGGSNTSIGDRLTLPRKFGLVSVPAGVDRESLQAMHADERAGSNSDTALSGKATRRILLDLKDNQHYVKTLAGQNSWEGRVMKSKLTGSERNMYSTWLITCDRGCRYHFERLLQSRAFEVIARQYKKRGIVNSMP
jgi:hypothetical protein